MIFLSQDEPLLNKIKKDSERKVAFLNNQTYPAYLSSPPKDIDSSPYGIASLANTMPPPKEEKKGDCWNIFKLKMKWKIILLPSFHILTDLSVRIMLRIPFEACPRVLGLFSYVFTVFLLLFNWLCLSVFLFEPIYLSVYNIPHTNPLFAWSIKINKAQLWRPQSKNWQELGWG